MVLCSVFCVLCFVVARATPLLAPRTAAATKFWYRLAMTRLLAALLAVMLVAPIGAQDKPQDKPDAKKDPVADKKKADKNELPLDPKDKLEFETDEGTWISLDVTPDGKAVVFELLGDIYTVPTGGGD